MMQLFHNSPELGGHVGRDSMLQAIGTTENIYQYIINMVFCRTKLLSSKC